MQYRVLVIDGKAWDEIHRVMLANGYADQYDIETLILDMTGIALKPRPQSAEEIADVIARTGM